MSQGPVPQNLTHAVNITSIYNLFNDLCGPDIGNLYLYNDRHGPDTSSLYYFR